MYYNMKMVGQKIAAALLALLMILSAVSTVAEDVKQENMKHERVFAVVSADGTLRSLTDSIRLENAEGLEELTDRTLLTDIQNVGGEEAFTLKDDVLTWQAAGKDITYQGISEKPLPVTPVVSFRLNGEEVSAEALENGTGQAEITVTYQLAGEVPHLAATFFLLPENGISNLKLENATLVSFSGRQAVLGWAVPGADEALNLPASFSVSWEADHAKPAWMMTFASADPIDLACSEIDSRLGFDPQAELTEIETLLTAMQKGETLPATSGKTLLVSAQVNELNNGLQSLNDGAQALADGAATLETGLSTLSENSAALNDGADAIFAAILDTANQQIAASGLAEAGIEMPELTPENYDQELTATVTKLAVLGNFSEEAKTAHDSLQALQNQLNQISTFVTGVHAYTGGVDHAAAGATELSAGAAKLHDEGTDVLCAKILGAEKLAAGMVLPWVKNQLSDAVRVFGKTRDQARDSGYDLRPDSMKTLTVYIIRSDC